MSRRVDLVLAERGLVPSREKARALIQDGAVTCDGERVRKPGQLVLPDADFHVDKLFRSCFYNHKGYRSQIAAIESKKWILLDSKCHKNLKL